MRVRAAHLFGLALGLAAAVLLLAHTAVARAGTDYAEMLAFRRLWSDWALGVTYFLDARFPVSAEKEARRPWPEWAATVETYKQLALVRIRQEELSPLRFWRAVKVEPFQRERGRPQVEDADDPGRAEILAWGFRLLGGPAPFLVLWLAPLAAVPVLMWTAAELVRAGRPVAAAAFLALLGFSPFVVEVLSLPRSAVGFHLLALLLVVPLATYAALGAPPTWRGLSVRAALGGVLFGLFAVCRSSALLMLGGFVLALALAAARIDGARGGARLAATLGLTVLFVAPYLVLRAPQHHDVWAAVWEGLGDFDREKGHAWSDDVAEQVVRAEGASSRTSAEGQAILRRLVLREVRDDPGWYARILAHRIAATVTQEKLWPRASVDGLWMARARSANEGFLDKYYAYTTTVDFFGFGAHQVELPVGLLAAPSLAVVALAFWPRRDSGRSPLRATIDAAAASARSDLRVMGCAAVAALPVPVLLTTAGGAEPQAFAIVYFLGAAFAAEALVRAAVARFRAARASSSRG
jgi:hypothetical protein